VPLGDMLINQIASDTGVAMRSAQLYDEATAPFENETRTPNSDPTPPKADS